MTLLLEDMKEEREFEEILRMLFAAFGEPYNSLRRWFIPVHTTEEAAIEGLKERSVKYWKQNPDIHWLKITDTESGRVVGAAEWEVRKKVDSVGAAPKPVNAYWYTEGSEEKAFTEKLLTSLKGFTKEKMARPHIELEQLVVHPEHRRRGAGKLLMDWGIRKADELGLESYVNERWKEYAADDLRVFLVWRPAGHYYRAGEDKLPWLNA